jgi:hypothetical protein
MPDSFLWRASKAAELGRLFRKTDTADYISFSKESTVDPERLFFHPESCIVQERAFASESRPVCVDSVFGVWILKVLLVLIALWLTLGHFPGARDFSCMVLYH